MGSRRAQSESIGVILLTVVVVVTVGVGSAVFLGGVADDVDRTSAPLVDFGVEITATDVAITHAGGDVVAESDLTVIVRGNGTTERYGVDSANVSGDGDGQFEPSERFRRDHGLVGPRVEVTVVHDASNTVLARESVTVGERAGRPPTARFSASPDDPDPDETVTFDASASADDGTIAEYRWDFGDGTTATTTDPTVEHTYDSEGTYTVNLTVEDGDGATDTASNTYQVTDRRAPDSPDDVTQGLTYEYYEDTYTSLPDFDAATPVRTGSVDTFDISPRDRDDNFAFRYTGYVEVPESGEYTFTTESDDGSELYIGEQRVVENGGLHSDNAESGTIALQPGRHAITVTYFEHTGAETLDVRWSGPGVTDGASIPEDRLYRNATPTAAFTEDCDGLTCTFDASLSTAPSSTITSYEWAVAGETNTTSDPTFAYEFDSGGSYDVTLTVTTADGETATAERTVTAVEPRPAANPADTTAGLAYSYYENETIDDRGDLQSSAIVRNGTTDQFDLEPTHRDENYGFRYTGYVEVPETGNYTFYTTSDDGSRLSIGDELVVQNDGLHANRTRSGEIALEAGKHPITVTFFEHTIDDGLVVEYAGPGVSRQEIPASALSRDVETARWESTDDWDGSVASESVVHADFGDRSAGAVELGYAPTDTGGANLSAYWPLDEDDGTTATDASPNENTGTILGDVTPGATGITGSSSYEFGGTDGRVSVDDDPSLPEGDELTVSLWVRTTSFSDAEQTYLVDQSVWSDRTGFAILDDGQYGEEVHFRVLGDGTFYDVSVARDRVNDGEWHNIVGTYSQGTQRIYLDGTLVEERTDSTYDPAVTDLGIGGSAGGYAPLAGTLDEVRLYNRSLSTAEVDTVASTGDRGSLTTATKTLDAAVTPSGLQLRNVSATRPSGTSVEVTVLSDPDDDGTFEERSDAITLDGSSSYDVTGLTGDSRRYRLEIELSTSSSTTTPTVDRLELSG